MMKNEKEILIASGIICALLLSGVCNLLAVCRYGSHQCIGYPAGTHFCDFCEYATGSRWIVKECRGGEWVDGSWHQRAPIVIQHCPYGCKDGACFGNCKSNSDCPDPYYGTTTFCSEGGDVYRAKYRYRCVDYTCTIRESRDRVLDCAYGCADGMCLPAPSTTIATTTVAGTTTITTTSVYTPTTILPETTLRYVQPTTVSVSYARPEVYQPEPFRLTNEMLLIGVVLVLIFFLLLVWRLMS